MKPEDTEPSNGDKRPSGLNRRDANTSVNFPNPRHVYTDIEGPVPRNQEFDAKDYYPANVYRKPDPVWPLNFKIDIGKMLRDKLVSKIKSVFGDDD